MQSWLSCCLSLASHTSDEICALVTYLASCPAVHARNIILKIRVTTHKIIHDYLTITMEFLRTDCFQSVGFLRMSFFNTSMMSLSMNSTNYSCSGATLTHTACCNHRMLLELAFQLHRVQLYHHIWKCVRWHSCTASKISYAYLQNIMNSVF